MLNQNNNLCLRKRLLLIFCFTPFFMFLGKPYNDKKLVLLYIFITVLSFLYNFQYFTIFFHEKPVYFEDLKDTNNKVNFNPTTNLKFQNIFIFIHQITLSMAFVIIIDYFYHRINTIHFTLIEILGIVGGFISLYQKITSLLGNILIKILYHTKKINDKYKNEVEFKITQEKKLSLNLIKNDNL
jgi:uncharacterized Tic20 family protein